LVGAVKGIYSTSRGPPCRFIESTLLSPQLAQTGSTLHREKKDEERGTDYYQSKQLGLGSRMRKTERGREVEWVDRERKRKVVGQKDRGRGRGWGRQKEEGEGG